MMFGLADSPITRPASGFAVKATAEVLIRGHGNAWEVAGPSDTSPLEKRRVVELAIQGNGKEGDHLVMSPEGCFKTLDGELFRMAGRRQAAKTPRKITPGGPHAPRRPHRKPGRLFRPR